jgi:plasmid stabilization system protein ParE
MNQFVLTPAAEGDLLIILEYLEGERPSAALRVLDALEQAMQFLAENPGVGHVRSDLTGQEVRFWTVFNYLVIFRPGTEPLQIVRVLHGKRDVSRLLGDSV